MKHSWETTRNANSPCTYGGNRFSQQIFTRNTNFNLCNNRRDESSKWSSSGVQGIKQIDPSTAVATGHARLLAKNKRYICIYAFCMRVFSNCCPPGSWHTPLKLASYAPYILGSPANHLCLYLAHCTHLLTFRIDEAFMGNHSKCKLPLHIWRKSFFAANIYKKYEF